MKLNSKVLDKLMNSDIIKTVYPIIDKIETIVEDDGDDTDPFYKIVVKIYLNDDSITENNMYKKGLDPHYLIDIYMIDLLKLVSVSTREIEQIYIKLFNPEGKLIYPS